MRKQGSCELNPLQSLTCKGTFNEISREVYEVQCRIPCSTTLSVYKFMHLLNLTENHRAFYKTSYSTLAFPQSIFWFLKLKRLHSHLKYCNFFKLLQNILFYVYTNRFYAEIFASLLNFRRISRQKHTKPRRILATG